MLINPLKASSKLALASQKKFKLCKGHTLLFQGDSITDAGRDKKQQVANQQLAFGKVYASMVAAHLLVQHNHLNLKIHNRGISGNKVHQLADRWDRDCINLKPDLISILIGVNDIWHGPNGRYDGKNKTYETDYDKLLHRTRKALPDTQLVICEPFVLKCGAINEKWFPEFDGYRAVSQKMAVKYKAIFVSFQEMFDQALKFSPRSIGQKMEFIQVLMVPL